MGCGGSKPADEPKAVEAKASPTDVQVQVKSGVSSTPATEEVVDVAPAKAPAAEEEAEGPLTKEEIAERITCSDEIQRFKLGSTGVTLRYAYVSQRGFYPDDPYKNNQDAFKIIECFNGNPDQILLGVFDGHGGAGDDCSYFVRDNIEDELQYWMTKHPNDFDQAYLDTFLGLSAGCHEAEFDDNMSGTTAIVAFFNKTDIVIANIGDSRAMVGDKEDGKIVGHALSMDQTPYRADERERIKKAGGVVMSMDMLEGTIPYHENWNLELGEAIDDNGDPPRVWAPGQAYPGCAYTRAIGDALAGQCGVNAEAELTHKTLNAEDQFFMLASDGVWEFLTNQTVADMVSTFDDPLSACRAVVAESYRLWLQYEVRTDDITVILAFIEHDEEPTKILKNKRASERVASAARAVTAKPVRRAVSVEKKESMNIHVSSHAEEDLSDWVLEKVPKSDEEVGHIKRAVKANFLFAHLNETQAQMVYDVMSKKHVKKGDAVVKQGDVGDYFYVVEDGEYVVTIATPNGGQMEVLTYSTAGGTNPCFGELALMYGKPRAATVTAKTDGVLWAMDRRSFRAILLKSSGAEIKHTLRSVEMLKSLSNIQLNTLQDKLSEVAYKPDEYVIKQGDDGSNMYIIMEGGVRITKTQADGTDAPLMELGSGSYFGERALLQNEKRAANVIANSKLKCLYISKKIFEEVLGPLQSIIDEDRIKREAIAQKKLRMTKEEGLQGVDVPKLRSAMEGVSCECHPFQYALCKLDATHEFTVKIATKARVHEEGLEECLESEKEIRSLRAEPHRMVPIALLTLEDDEHHYTVFHDRVAMPLAALIGEEGFKEEVAKFYVASVVLALEQLREDSIICRNLTDDAIVIDEKGYVQLMDMRYAVKADSMPTDFCGYAHYLAPEQVDGQGHGIAVDCWALGILTYEMCCGGANPWLTGDKIKDSEVGIYTRITGHEAGALEFPDAEETEDLVVLLNDLLHPDPAKRLGAREGGLREVRDAKWFAGFDWSQLESGNMVSPHAQEARKALDDALKASVTPA